MSLPNPPTMLQGVKAAFRDYLWSQRAVIDRAFAGYDLSLQKIYEYESHTIVVDEFPCLVLSNPRVGGQPLAAPYLVENRFEVPITGYVLLEKADENANVVTRFADLVKYALTIAPDLRIPTGLMNRGMPVSLHPGPEALPPFLNEYLLSYEAQPGERQYLHIFEGNLIGFIDAGLGDIA